MEEVLSKPTVDYIPLMPQKTKKNTTFTQITNENVNGHDLIDGCANVDLSSMHSLVLNSKSSSATVFVAANQPDRAATKPETDVLTKNGPHVVTIRINPDTDKSKIPKISSVHLKADAQFDSFQIKELCKKNNSLVRLNVDERPKIIEEDAKPDKPPYIYCNSYLNTSSNMVMSSGQCSPSDTLDSGTCSDLDGTPPPLPKKKTSKSTKKAVSVTVIKSSNGHDDFEDNDSNLSYDSLNSSELNGSVHADDISNHNDYSKKDKKSDPPAAPQMPLATKINKDFLPRDLLQDIRERSAKLNTVETESDLKTDEEELKQNINENANVSKESAQLTSFRLVSQFNSELNKNDSSQPQNVSKTPVIVSESTYEERKKEEKIREENMCYSTHYFDTDKFYDFHLNEKQFDDVKSVKSASVDRESDDELVYFAGVKDYRSDEAPSTIRSSKGTIRGVKNRVRAGIATFLQMQNTNVKSYKEKDAGKVVLYTTTMGIVRSTYQRCVLVKKILRNLLVKYEERDVFMSMEYQDEIRDRMGSEMILVPQLYIDGMHIGDADTVEKLNESGELRKMLKPYKSPDACTTCQMCGGFRLLPCRICNGSKKSLHRNHFTAEFVALKCMNCDEVGLVRCEACS